MQAAKHLGSAGRKIASARHYRAVYCYYTGVKDGIRPILLALSLRLKNCVMVMGQVR